ncbi:hypothetical protein [Streptomyces sp. NBC_01216]|uniref:hypothetical protein n=1 Tax=unclassified Streptomyces TaxID=2593676 RepID=UPI002E0EE21A|nr:hypothetical protein OG393_23130 [Streptomyces sp. NBC_01216]
MSSSTGTWQITDREGGVLAARWWQWALSAPEDRSPVADRTGEHAAWRQPDDLWFLAGTYGGHVVRHCEVPADRPLFLPVLNIQHTKHYSRTPLRLTAVEASAHLNGIPLPVREFTSPFFPVGLRTHIAWGLWAGLDPLLPGGYVLEIKGRATNGFWVDTVYHLTVVEA